MASLTLWFSINVFNEIVLYFLEPLVFIQSCVFAMRGLEWKQWNCYFQGWVIFPVSGHLKTKCVLLQNSSLEIRVWWCPMWNTDCFSKRHKLLHSISDSKVYSRLGFVSYESVGLPCHKQHKIHVNIKQQNEKNKHKPSAVVKSSLPAIRAPHWLNFYIKCTDIWRGEMCCNPDMFAPLLRRHLSTRTLEWVQRRVTKRQFGRGERGVPWKVACLRC